MEERQRKLDEQRRKEAHRRAAAEEKRKQRQEEDKEHYESVLRRSLERSQKLDQRQKRWSWGGGLTADAESNLYPRSASASPLHPSRGPIRSRSIDRQGSPSDGLVCNTQKSEKEKRFSSPGSKRPASPSSGLSRRRSPSPAAPLSNSNKRPPSPAAPKQSSRNRPPSPSSSKQRPPSPSPQPSSKPPPIQRPALTPTGPPALRKRDPKPKEGSAGQTLAPQSPDVPSSSNAASSKTKDDSTAKGIAGTTSAETAAKTLSENRRLAREQKEREELLRVQREEEERLRKEEEKRLLKEKRARQAEEEKMRAEQRKIEEEERARVAEEERERLELEEQERQVELQREREEAEVRALEEAEKQRQERARIMQQNQQERMARRKRIEEIMKRTRKTDQNDFKRDEEKGMLDENEEEDSEAKEDGAKEEEDDEDDEDCANSEAELEAEGWSLPGEGPMAEREGSVNGELAMDNKEYRSVSVEDAVAVSLTTKVHLVEGSEFVNEDSKMGMLPGLNGKVGSWSFEELIDLGVHPRAAPLISAAGGSEKPRVAFEDKGGAVTAVHPGQPVEPLSEM